VEGTPLVVRGHPLGQDGGDDAARAGRAFRRTGLLHPRHHPFAQLLGQALHGGEQELFLGAEVVLHQPQRHPGLGRDLAHPGGVQASRGRRPHQRVRDLLPPLLMIDPLRHPLTVPPSVCLALL
jgi:hypothetical protein